MNALKIVGKKMSDAQICMLGAGAANIAIARIIIAAGVTPGNIVMVDSRGILSKDRTDLKEKNPVKWNMCLITNKENRNGDLKVAMKGMDAIIAMSQPGPGTIPKECIKLMNADPIVFACANPIPEIWPWEAEEAGARIVATGRSDFPNQVNNSLGFPGIFRGTLDARAKTITDEMCIAAARELAKIAEEKGLHEDYIIPYMSEWEVYPREAAAVGLEAVNQGIARLKLSRRQFLDRADAIISKSRKTADLLMKKGIIKNMPLGSLHSGGKRWRTSNSRRSGKTRLASTR
jgi:malate dehydrogenase (oxaloacetate-decarboxylating)